MGTLLKNDSKSVIHLFRILINYRLIQIISPRINYAWRYKFFKCQHFFCFHLRYLFVNFELK